MTSGIARSIDDLGRIVIPKEIRRKMNIGCGDYMELSVNENSICLTPYDEAKDMTQHITTFINNVDDLAFFCDKDDKKASYMEVKKLMKQAYDILNHLERS